MKLWQSSFGSRPAPKAEAFSASIGFDQRLWPYDLAGSAAHCRMLARQRIIPSADAQAILTGLATIRDELTAAQLDLSPHWEDIHTRVEARLHELIGEAAGHLPTARSRNDQVATDVRLFARDALVAELGAIATLERVLLDLAARHRDALMPGYTHLQRAQPVLFAHHVLAYVEMFHRDAHRLLDCYARTDVLPLGSGALAGVPYPIDRQMVAGLLGFSSVAANSIDAVSDRDFAIELLAALAIISMHLSRLAEELVMWSSSEFAFIRIGEAYSTGSSIMPQKRNPDLAELVRGKTGRVYGHLQALLTTLKGQSLAYNRDLQEDKETLFDAVDTVQACLEVGAEMLASLQVNTQRMAAGASAGELLATDYADYLVKKGMPFRQAHAVVGQLVREAEATGRPLTSLSLEELKAAAPLFEADVLNLTAETSVRARDIPGGTAPAQVAAAQRQALARLDRLEGEIARLREALPDLDRLLSDPLQPG